MRKFLIPAAILVSTLAAAAPAAAQWAQPGYGSGTNNYGQSRRLDARIDQLQRQIRRLDVRNVIGHSEAQRLAYQAQNLEQRLRMFANNGLDRRERYDIENRIARLEQRIQQVVNNERYGRNAYGNGNNGFDRDRDGRDDRYEDDRGRDSDRRRDRDDDDD